MARKINLEGEIEKVKIQLKLLLDRSGSMKNSEKKTVDSINEYLNGMKLDPNANYEVTLAQFDAMPNEPILQYTFKSIPIEQFEDLTVQMYQPRGNTPLWDAIGQLIEESETGNDPVLTVVITDGMENQSTKHDSASIKKLRKEKEENGWTFVFLGADIDAYAEGSKIGMKSANTANYTKGMEAMVAGSLIGATQTYSNARMMSFTATGGVRGLRSASVYNQGQTEQFFNEEERSSMIGGVPKPALPRRTPKIRPGKPVKK